MKKKLVSVLALGIAIGGVALLPTGANAASNKEDTGVGIGFMEDGDNTVVPGPYVDSLGFVYKPTEFQFGSSNKASSVAATYNQITKSNQFIGVYDDRGNDKSDTAKAESGWVVKAQMSELKDAKGGVLPSTLSFDTGDVKQTFTLRDKDGKLPENAPKYEALNEANKVTDLGKDNQNLVGVKNVQLVAGAEEATPIITATQDLKRGGSVTSITNGRLLVNADPKTGAVTKAGNSFSGRVTFTLDDVK